MNTIKLHWGESFSGGTKDTGAVRQLLGARFPFLHPQGNTTLMWDSTGSLTLGTLAGTTNDPLLPHPPLSNEVLLWAMDQGQNRGSRCSFWNARGCFTSDGQEQRMQGASLGTVLSAPASLRDTIPQAVDRFECPSHFPTPPGGLATAMRLARGRLIEPGERVWGGE